MIFPITPFQTILCSVSIKMEEVKNYFSGLIQVFSKAHLANYYFFNHLIQLSARLRESRQNCNANEKLYMIYPSDYLVDLK